MAERTISKADMDAAIAAAEAKYGDKLPKGLLRQMAEVESAYGTKLSNPSGARGPWQFMPKTGPAYGLATEEDRMDPYKSADAAARLLMDNKRDLEKRIGRPVTNGELYLAHQQGASGAAKLLKDPNRNAAEVVGAERVRQNLPKSRQGEHTNLTTGDFAKLWTSKFDGGAGAPPGKKSEPRATGSLGELPDASFLTYNPNSLAQLNRESEALARRTSAPAVSVPEVPAVKGSLATNLGSLGTVARPAPGEPPAPRPNKSTAIIAGLSTVDKLMQRNAAIASTVEGVEPTRVAPSGIAGEFSAGIDAGTAGLERDRAYFGVILDTLTGNKKGAKSNTMNAEIAEQQAAFALAGMPSFEDFMNAPTLDGFITQMVSATGQVAPSALESMAAALVSGGGAILAKAGMSVASKAVVKELVTDILKKKVAGEAVDAAEDGALKVLFETGKKGAMAGAFGQEFVSGSAASISEFKEAGKDINMEEALGALAMGVPQALVGAGSEIFLVKAFGEAALKKSSRMAGDNVFKRFASDMGALMGKAAISEGTTEAVQEGLLIAQRKTIDPTYDDEEAQLRLAQSVFSGFFGGGLFAGGAAAPVSAISALNRKTETDPNAPAPAVGTTDGTPPPGNGTPPKPNLGDRLKGVMKKATGYIEDSAKARVEAEAKKVTKGVDDSVLTGNTAAEGTVVLGEQFKEMMDPASPRKHVWIAENDFDTTLDTYQQERLKREGYFVEEQTDPANKGKKLEYTFVPGKGVMVGEVKANDTAPPGAILRNLVKSKAPEERLNRYIGAMLGMADTGGVKGDTVVRAKNKQGVPIAEQTTTPEGVPEAAAAMQAQAPNAEIEVVPVEQSLEERKQRVDAEQTAADFFARFNEPTPVAPVNAKLSMAERDALFAPVEDDAVRDMVIDPKNKKQIAGATGKTPTLIDSVYRAMGATDDPNGQWNEPDNAKVISLIDGAVADDTVSEAEMKTAFKEVHDDWRTDMTGWDKAKIAAAWKDWGGWQASETRDMKIDPKNKNPGKTAGYTAPKAVERKGADGKVKKIPVESKGGKVKGKPATATPYPVVREEGDSTESFQKMEPTGSPDSRGEVDIDPEDQNRELSFDEMLVDRFPQAIDNPEIVGKDYAKKEAPIPWEKRTQKFRDEVKELRKRITSDLSIASIKKYLPVMMDSMVTNLLARVKRDAESIFTVEEAPGNMLHLVKRDDTVREDTTIEQRAVRNVIAMITGKSWNRQSGMTWFLREEKPGDWVMEQTGTSLFWLYDTATDKSYHLIGNRAKEEGGFARPGLMALAQAGVKLNVNTKSGIPEGDGLTERQKIRLGFQTMIGALMRSGYQLRVGRDPRFALPFKSVQDLARNAEGPDRLALTEVVATIGGKPAVLSDLLGGALPFDTTSDGPKVASNKSDVTGVGGTEQVTAVVNNPEFTQPENEGDRPTATGRILPGQRTDKRAAPDPNIDPEVFALNEDKLKDYAGRRTEAREYLEKLAARNARMNKAFGRALKKALRTGTDFEYLHLLPEIPSDITFVMRAVNNAFVVTITSPRYKEMKVEADTEELAVALAHKAATQQPGQAANRYSRLLLEASDNATTKGQAKYDENTGVGTPRDQTSVRDMPLSTVDKNVDAIRTMGNFGPMTSRLIGIASGLFNIQRPTTIMTLRHLKANFNTLVGPGGQYENNADVLMQAILDLEDEKSQARVIMGKQNIIVVRAEPRTPVDGKGKAVFATDDAVIASMIAHEFGHILFRQEYEAIRSDTSAKRVLWDAYRERVFKFGAQVPSQYLTPKPVSAEPTKPATKAEIDAELQKRLEGAAGFADARPDGTNEEEEYAAGIKAYRATRAEVEADLNKQPEAGEAGGQLSLPGFEEWYADQVMTFVYNEGQKAKNGADMYFKRMADSFRDFFRRVTAALGFRLWESRLAAGNRSAQQWREANMVLSDNAKTPNDIKEGQWTFAEYMNEVIKSHAVQRKLNNDLPVVSEVIIRDMALNIAGRLPVNAARNVANAARRLLTTGSFGNVAYKLHNILWASTDFMGNAAHGRGGQELKNFFGTLSQKVVGPGWNKNKIFAENRFNTELARILGITRKSGADDWKSQRVTDILNEAADNNIPTAQLSSQEAKDIRAFFKKIMDEYITDPATGLQWVDVGNLPNFGGSRMYDIEKIANDIDAFVDWVVAQPQWSGTRDMAMAMAKRIISHTGDPVANLTAEVDHDIATGAIPNTPEGRAAEMLFRSMEQHAVTPVRESVIKGAKDGAYTFSDLLTTLRAKYPPAASNPTDQSLAFLHAIDATGTDVELESDIKEFWRQRTERMRLSPGMDPALSRTGLDRIGTKAFREAIPGDPNGWLIPQAKANSQYLHYVTRKVEYNKMGGYERVSAALNSISREYRQQVDDAVMANLGKFGENIGPKWRTFNSVAAVWTVYTTLLFAALTSITDLSGILVRSKEFDNMGSWFAAMKEAMSNDEWKKFAEDIGVVTMRSQDHAMIGHGELDYANNTSRALMNGFFRATGLEFFTRFSRTMAVGMGRQFIVRTAERADFDAVKHGRWLAELGLTRADVQAWTASNNDMSTPVGLKVRDAIARFADEAVIRPDASQRPTWASSPYFQVIWQLKSYYYGFGKTVLGGMGREMKNRYDETGSISEAAGPALLMAVTIIPLTMLGLSSREWLKWLFQLVIPGVEETPSMTSKMDGGEYTWEIFKRSGVLGPFSLGLTTMEAFKWEGIAAPFTANVPMFDLFDDTLFDGDWTRPLPVINNIK